MKQRRKIKGVDLICAPYQRLSIPPKSIVYCDPPYSNTVGYGQDFISKYFWVWCEALVEQGHQVFVSEYVAPPEWKVVWGKQTLNTLDIDTGGKKGIEKLFVHRSQN